jgi:hypothetical protein
MNSKGAKGQRSKEYKERFLALLACLAVEIGDNRQESKDAKGIDEFFVFFVASLLCVFLLRP